MKSFVLNLLILFITLASQTDVYGLTEIRNTLSPQSVQINGDNYKTLYISEWVGQRFVFLPRQKIFQKYGYQLVYNAEQRIGSLPYDAYVGRIARVLTVTQSRSGSWTVQLLVEGTGELLEAFAAGGTIEGLGLVSDLQNARATYKGRTIWLRNSTMRSLSNDGAEILSVDILKPVKVIDVISSFTDEAPVRFIIEANDGLRGFVDVNMSGTNVAEILRKYHRFESEFSSEEFKDRPAISSTVPNSLTRPSDPNEKDVLGWQGARWGMTEAEIVNTFGANLRKLPKRDLYKNAYVDYVIPNLRLNEEDFTVHFQMDSRTQRLTQVLIQLNESKSSSPRTDAFTGLEKLLEEKYGEPTSKSNKTEYVISLDRRWTFRTTIIELSYSYIRSISASTLSISYFPSASSDASKL